MAARVPGETHCSYCALRMPAHLTITCAVCDTGVVRCSDAPPAPAVALRALISVMVPYPASLQLAVNATGCLLVSAHNRPCSDWLVPEPSKGLGLATSLLYDCLCAARVLLLVPVASTLDRQSDDLHVLVALVQ